MYFILDEITKVLKDGLIDIKDINIVQKKIDSLDENHFPFISIYDNGFTFDKIGIGYTGGQRTQQIVEQEFDSDGKKIIFKLEDRPLRPILSIQSPKGITRKEKDEYFFDYFKNEIKFVSPPQKGKKNVIIKYMLAKNSAEIKLLRLKLNCVIDIWSSNDNIECDSITLQIIKTILLSEDSLYSKNIHIQGLNCINLNTINEEITDNNYNNYGYSNGNNINNGNNNNNNNNSNNSNNHNKKIYKDGEYYLFGRRLNYKIETDITTDIHIPIIEDIKIKEKKIHDDEQQIKK